MPAVMRLDCGARAGIWSCFLLVLMFLFFVPLRSVVAQTNEDLHAPFKYKLQSKHFVFYSVTNTSARFRYVEFLEDFLVCLNSHFVRITDNWYLTVYLYPDVETLNQEGCVRGQREPIRGRFVEFRNAVFTYDDSGIGILAHEVMHKVVHENFKELEPWAKEGIPSFFEDIYGYRSPSGPVLYMGYQNPWRIAEMGEGLKNLTLQGILDSAASTPFTESDKRVLVTFLFYEGKLTDYFKLAGKAEHRGYKTLVEAVFQEKLAALEPRFKEFVKAIYANQARLVKLPEPRYFQVKADFDTFYREHRDALDAKPLAPWDKMKFVN